MIEIRNFTKRYGEKIAVNNMNLTINNGEVFGLIGHNGAGKSTTIKSITGVISVDEGNIAVNGFDVRENGFEAKKCIGYVSDTPDKFLKLTAGSYYNFVSDIFGISLQDRIKRIDVYQKMLNMENESDTLIEEMSHGMRQKVFVIGALIANPEVWILDEPMTGLDPKASWNLKQTIREHADKGNTVLFSTHVLEVAEKLCDRIGIIHKGNLIFVGTLEELKKNVEGDSLEEIYINLIDEKDKSEEAEEGAEIDRNEVKDGIAEIDCTVGQSVEEAKDSSVLGEMEGPIGKE